MAFLFNKGDGICLGKGYFLVKGGTDVGKVCVKMICNFGSIISIVTVNGEFSGLGFGLLFFIYNFFDNLPRFF